MGCATRRGPRRAQKNDGGESPKPIGLVLMVHDDRAVSDDPTPITQAYYFGKTPRGLLRDRNISLRAKVLYALLDDYANRQNRESFPGRQALADDLGCSRNTVTVAMRELESHGWIKRVARYDSTRRAQKSNLIQLFDKGRQPAPPPHSGELGWVIEANNPPSLSTMTHEEEPIEEEPVEEDPPLVTETAREEGAARGGGSGSAVAAQTREDVSEVLDYLDAALARNEVKLPKRNKSNVNAARLLLDRDGRSVDQVKRAIDFATTDEFWRANILSMSKLRDKYDTLRLRAQSKRSVRDPQGDMLKRMLDDATSDRPSQIGVRG